MPSGPALASEPVEPGRIVDQDLLADGGVRRPDRKLVQQPAVIDLEQRRHVGDFRRAG